VGIGFRHVRFHFLRHALPLLDKAALLNLANRAAAFYGLQNYADAAEAFERITSPAYWDHGYLAACYAQLGRPADARSRIARALELAPHLTLKHVSDREWYSRQADLEHLLDALRKAGLPD
jgi:adenylate cyclase